MSTGGTSHDSSALEASADPAAADTAVAGAATSSSESFTPTAALSDHASTPHSVDALQSVLQPHATDAGGPPGSPGAAATPAALSTLTKCVKTQSLTRTLLPRPRLASTPLVPKTAARNAPLSWADTFATTASLSPITHPRTSSTTVDQLTDALSDCTTEPPTLSTTVTFTAERRSACCRCEPTNDPPSTRHDATRIDAFSVFQLHATSATATCSAAIGPYVSLSEVLCRVFRLSSIACVDSGTTTLQPSIVMMTSDCRDATNDAASCVRGENVAVTN